MDLLISIHILHTKDDEKQAVLNAKYQISIHILHTKDDYDNIECVGIVLDFNPHPSYEG